MQIVYARRDDLLGGCLMNLAHSWGFADKLGAKLILNWLDEHPGRPYMPWGEIFQSAPFTVVTRPELDWSGAYHMPRKPQWSVALKTYPEIFYVHASWVQVDGVSKSDDEPRIRQLLHTLPIQPAVAWAVEAISARVGTFTAVHVRRGDDILAVLRSNDRTERFDRACSSFAKRCLDLVTYKRAIEANTNDDDLLIFSNDIVEAECLAGMMSKRYVTQVGDQPEFVGLTPTQRDFAEMLLMSRATRIIGTHSNYSRFARLFGGCPLIAAHPWVSRPHLREFVESTVPPRAMQQVLDGYRKIFSRLTLK